MVLRERRLTMTIEVTNTGEETPSGQANISFTNCEQEFETKLTISVVDSHVKVVLEEGVTMDEAARTFFDNLDQIMPHWFAAAGYVKVEQHPDVVYD